MVQRYCRPTGSITRAHFRYGKEVRVVLGGIRERGQGLVEGAFILALMAMVIFFVLVLP